MGRTKLIVQEVFQDQMRLRKSIILSLVCVLLTDCSKMNCAEYLQQPTENIKRVELISNRAGERSVLVTLSEEQLTDFLTKMSSLTIGQNREPQGSLGYLVVGLYYADGYVQVIGSQASAYGTSIDRMELELDSWHYIKYSDLYDLFSQYVDEELWELFF